jgi:hypothetical protein
MRLPGQPCGQQVLGTVYILCEVVFLPLHKYDCSDKIYESVIGAHTMVRRRDGSAAGPAFTGSGALLGTVSSNIGKSSVGTWGPDDDAAGAGAGNGAVAS